MGVPINQIIVATNANDVLSHVIETGVFRKMKDLDETDEFALDAAPFQNLHTVFSTFSVNQAQTLDATKTIYDEKGRKLDPHTCIALVSTQSAAAQKKVLALSWPRLIQSSLQKRTRCLRFFVN